MKKFFVLLMTLIMSISLVACSSGSSATDSTPTDEVVDVEDITTLEAEITWWAFPTFTTVDGVSGKYEESLVAAFNEKYPNIKVNVEMIDFTNGPEKIVTAIQGNTAPDVLFDAPGRIIDYGRSGYLVSLNDLVEETGLLEDIANPNILEASSDGETYWMYPTSAAPFVMAVNKTALEKEGLFDLVPSEGDRTWTTDEFIELSKKMQEAGYYGVEIFAGGQGGDQGTRAFITNLTNANLMNADLSEYTLSEAAGVEALTLINDGVKAGWLAANTGGVANDALEHFTTPTNSTFWAVALWSPNLHSARQEELDASNIEAIAVTLPSKDGSPKLEYLVNGYAIFDNKDATKIAAAKEFVKFLSDDEVIGKQNVLATNCFPVRTSFGDLYEGDENMSYYASLTKYYGAYYNTVNGFGSMRPFWWGSLQAMIIDDMNPEEAAVYFDENANLTLDE